MVAEWNETAPWDGLTAQAPWLAEQFEDWCTRDVDLRTIAGLLARRLVGSKTSEFNRRFLLSEIRYFEDVGPAFERAWKERLANADREIAAPVDDLLLDALTIVGPSEPAVWPLLNGYCGADYWFQLVHPQPDLEGIEIRRPVLAPELRERVQERCDATGQLFDLRGYCERSLARSRR